MTDEDRMKLARECAAEGFPNSAWAKLTLSGECDDDPEVQSALRAIKAERARTVAWLRKRDGNLSDWLADAIERGEHGE